MCPEWSNDFTVFLADMGEQPPGMQIDRINNDGNYEPENCRWATRAENRNNNSHIRLVTAFGKTQSVTRWAEELGVPSERIAYRIKRGWSGERAIGDPPLIAGGRKGWRKNNQKTETPNV